MNKFSDIVYSKDVVEFVTVGVQYCAFLETLEGISIEDLSAKLTKILPLLYLKATLLPETDSENEDEPEITVNEDDYNSIIAGLNRILGSDDAYLEVFMEDMKYSDTPIAASISEDLSDVYQDVKNFISIYQRGIIENMNDALYICNENFKVYWGQKLVNVLRALHTLRYLNNDFNMNEDMNEDKW